MIQTKFKEWLISTGNMRQITDLIQLETATAAPPVAPDAEITTSEAIDMEQ